MTFEIHRGGATVNGNRGFKKDRKVNVGIEKKHTKNGNKFLLARKIKFVVFFYKVFFFFFCIIQPLKVFFGKYIQISII